MDRMVWFNVPVCYLVNILNRIIDWASINIGLTYANRLHPYAPGPHELIASFALNSIKFHWLPHLGPI